MATATSWPASRTPGGTGGRRPIERHPLAGRAYGERDEALVREVGRDAFPVSDLEPGMRFQTPGDDGPEIVTVLETRDDSVLIDTNHPLAGQSLTYRVEVLDIRDATRAELAKGHPLPPGTTPDEVEDKKMV